MELKNGQRYEATIKLGFFESIAPNGAIVKKLEEAGFTSVGVSGAGAARGARGTWSGDTQDVTLPSQVTDVKAISGSGLG